MTGILWSTLRSLGQSKLLKLTILTPFVGSIVLFDDNVSNFLVNGRSVFLSFPHIDTDLAQKLSNLNTYKLYYFYLVFSFIGFGSLIFSILCPKQVKSASNEAEFINIEKPIFTQLRGGRSLDSASALYIKGQDVGGAKLRRRFMALSYTESDAMRYENLIHEMYQSGTGIDLGGPDDGFISSFDLPIYEMVAEMLRNRIRAHRALWTSFELASKEFSDDLLRIEFDAADKSKPISRAFVMTFYVIGFIFIAIPTGKTFLQIAGLWAYSLNIKVF